MYEQETFLYVPNELRLYKTKYFAHDGGMIEEISRELIASNISLPQARVIAGVKDGSTTE